MVPTFEGQFGRERGFLQKLEREQRTDGSIRFRTLESGSSQKMNLSGASYASAFSGSRPTAANFQTATGIHTSFSGGDLSYSKFQGAKLTHANLYQVGGNKIHFDGAI